MRPRGKNDPQPKTFRMTQMSKDFKNVPRGSKWSERTSQVPVRVHKAIEDWIELSVCKSVCKFVCEIRIYWAAYAAKNKDNLKNEDDL